MARRLGREDSQTRTALMDAVEAVMLKDGYAALSARSVARHAGLNYQLVFYYFNKIEDLFLATYRRRTERNFAKFEQALKSDRPLHAYWKASSDPSEGALSLEYMAMSNHNAAIREETMRHSASVAALVSEHALRNVPADLPERDVFTGGAIGLAVGALANNLGFQTALGTEGNAAETIRLIEWCLDRLEPPEDG